MRLDDGFSLFISVTEYIVSDGVYCVEYSCVCMYITAIELLPNISILSYVTHGCNKPSNKSLNCFSSFLLFAKHEADTLDLPTKVIGKLYFETHETVKEKTIVGHNFAHK